MHYAVVDNETNIITNVIIWDGESIWTPPENHRIFLVPEGTKVAVGWTCDGETIIDPNLS